MHSRIPDTVVAGVLNSVAVEVPPAGVTTVAAVGEGRILLVLVGNKRTVVTVVLHAVVVTVLVTSVAGTVAVYVNLVTVGVNWAVVRAVLHAVARGTGAENQLFYSLFRKFAQLV